MVSATAVSNQTVPEWVEWWVETDNQATRPFSHSPIKSSLSVWPYCPNARRNRCQDLKSFPLAKQRGTTRTTSYYVDEGYPAGTEIQQPLREWSSWRGSKSSTLETDVYVWCHTLLVVHARNDDNGAVLGVERLTITQLLGKRHRKTHWHCFHRRTLTTDNCL